MFDARAAKVEAVLTKDSCSWRRLQGKDYPSAIRTTSSISR